MPLDKSDPKAIKWMVAKGKYDENNLIHRFRFYRLYNGLSLFDIAIDSGIQEWELDQFEQYEIGNCLVSYAVLEDICNRIETYLKSKSQRIWEDYL